MLSPAVALRSSWTETLGSCAAGAVTVKGVQLLSSPFTCRSCTHSWSVPPRVPTLKTVLAKSDGDTSITCPPVCGMPLTTNWPPPTVPLESQRCSAWNPMLSGSEIFTRSESAMVSPRAASGLLTENDGIPHSPRH